MASISISASLQSAFSSHYIIRRRKHQYPAPSFRSKQITRVATLSVEGQNGFAVAEQERKPGSGLGIEDDESNKGSGTESSLSKFIDDRWKKGTWDLNMFVNNGRIDWDDLIVAEAKRRKFHELYPEASTNEDPVLFRSSIIPWWAWLKKSYLPEAELLNGRAAMIGFFASYFVDALTGLNMVGEAGNLVCKAGLFATVVAVVLIRRAEDFENLKKLADEATFYDKQWQATWKDQEVTNASSPDKIRD